MQSINDRSIAGGIAALERRFLPEPPPPSSRPVFMLASAWRSGSTLVQRLLMSGGDLLMWGEPYDHSSMIRRMSEALLPFDDVWPWDKWIVDPHDPPTPEKWIANAYPPANDFVAAHRAFFDRLFEVPARTAGFSRWGIKGVRLGGEHAVYLRYLYPDACFVFLHRNPYDAFLSYRLLHEIRRRSFWWYHRWPDDQVATATRFGEVWTTLTTSFLEHAEAVDAAVIAYEDVIRGAAIERLIDATSVAIDATLLDRNVGGTSLQPGKWDGAERALRAHEVEESRATVGPLARRLGYVGPTTGS